jgi:hypothetical protein
MTGISIGRFWIVSKLKTYYVDLKDGYDIGDLYEHKGEKYWIIEIEAFNQLMVVEEIKIEENL